ncbi:MAG TPA: hypothetical protein VGM88_27940 [Kofleriaceae bacterium]
MVLPLEADVDDLRAEVGTPGRYRLDPIDDGNKPIANAPAGYVMVHELAAPVPVTSNAGSALAPLPAATDSVVIEAMRMNAEIARSVVDRFPQMIEAAASLLRAADGAGLPSRPPRSGEEYDEEDHEDEKETPEPSSLTFELINNLVAQVIPIVVTSLAGKKMPKLGSVLDWRKAAAEGQQQKHQAPAVDVTTATEAPTEVAETSDALPPLDPKTMSHFLAVQSALAPNEAVLARQVAAELAPTELRAWFKELSALSVPDAVAKIRSMLGATPKTGGAS